MAWQSEALDPESHRTGEFDSGEPSLDLWLRDHAAGAEARRVARTFAWLGGALLADALTRVVAATSLVAARFVVVDALHETAALFSEHHGFRRIPGTLRLVQKVSDVAGALA